MPDIGVVVALPREAATLGPARAQRGSIVAARGLQVAVAGVGSQRAAGAAQRLLDAGARALVSWGVAGGLAPGLQPGDLVLAERLGSARGHVVVEGAWCLRLTQALRRMGAAVHVGPLWTSAFAITTLSRKQSLADDGYIAVDMEAAGVAHAAQAAGVPFIALKAICDPALCALPEGASRWVREDGRVRPVALAMALARGPRTWQSLRIMRADFNAACAGLRRAAEALASSWPP